jgi:hypothetical protein
MQHSPTPFHCQRRNFNRCTGLADTAGANQQHAAFIGHLF